MAEALNRHDLKAFPGCFESFSDFDAHLLRHTADDGVVWGECHWTARSLNMAGVTITGGKSTASSWRSCIWRRPKRTARTSTKPAGVGFENEGQVEEAFLGGDLRDVLHPDLVHLQGCEGTLHKVLGRSDLPP
jgi:hypothetical protein